MFRKQAELWFKRVIVTFIILGFLAASARLSFAPIMLFAVQVVCWAALFAGAAIRLARRAGWISRQARDAEQGSEDFGILTKRLPEYIKPAPIAIIRLPGSNEQAAAGVPISSGSGLHGTVPLIRGPGQPPVTLMWSVSNTACPALRTAA